MKQRKLFWVLVLLVASVWGAIAYKFNEAMSSSDVPGGSTTVSESMGVVDESRETPFAYPRDARDPFQFMPKRDSTKRALQRGVQTVLWSPPPYRLVGILAATRRKTITLEGTTSGLTYFLSVGDTLGGLRVLKIDANQVSYAYKLRKASWSLEEKLSVEAPSQ